MSNTVKEWANLVKNFVKYKIRSWQNCKILRQINMQSGESGFLKAHYIIAHI